MCLEDVESVNSTPMVTFSVRFCFSSVITSVAFSALIIGMLPLVGGDGSSSSSSSSSSSDHKEFTGARLYHVHFVTSQAEAPMRAAERVLGR